MCAGIAGPSGAGKSLMLRAVADLDPHDGEVELGGERSEAVEPSLWRRRVALLPAESRWWFDRVGDHFRDDSASALKDLGFEEDALEWEIRRLSSGEKQRLALLRLLENKPETLLLDEPTANLDAANIERMEGFILDYIRSRRTAAVWVSHDPEQLARVADRRYAMDRGRLEETA